MGCEVVYSCDNRYAMLAGVSMESLYAANKDMADLNVHILANQLSEENRCRLIAIADKYDRKIHFVDFDGKTLSREMNVDTQFWSIAAYARLFTSKLLPQVNKILYLDCDTLVLGSLEGLWRIDMGDYSCAAVAEPMSVFQKKNVKLNAEAPYFNSGIMLIDLGLWRRINAVEKALDCIRRHKGRVPYVDQGVINEVFREDILTLPIKYNVSTLYFDFSYKEAQFYRAGNMVYSKKEVEEAQKKPIILHFNSSFLTLRPWIQNSNHPCAALWDEHCEQTPWQDAEKWPDHPGTSKLILRWMFRHTPRRVGIALSRTVNSMIRPLLRM